MAQWKQIQLGTMKLRVRSLALLSGSRIRCCRELWCRSQTQLGSVVAVTMVQASSYSSDSTPCLGTSIYLRCGPKKWKNKNKNVASCVLYVEAYGLGCGKARLTAWVLSSVWMVCLMLAHYRLRAVCWRCSHLSQAAPKASWAPCA